MGYCKEPFEELDVMSDFLNNALANDPRYGKDYCRLLIKNLVGIDVKNINVIAQKIIGPTDPGKRGIRLDIEVKEYADDFETIVNIFDIEPHRQNDIDSHAKKSRFYQAKMDSLLLKSGGTDFASMPNLFIISITNYDPFDEDYMLYTIKNKCVELPDLCYDDGVTIFYFNTAGTKGGSKELKAFLTYLEESTSANIVNEAIQELAKYVNTIKQSPAEKEGYMTWGDKIDGIVKEAVNEAVAEVTARYEADTAKFTAENEALKKQIEELKSQLRQS